MADAAPLTSLIPFRKLLDRERKSRISSVFRQGGFRNAYLAEGQQLVGRTTGSREASKPRRREANKIEKLARIRAAAKKVFLRGGFEAATIREIAGEADVALGTLFLYAKNKQDLLLLLFDEEFLVIGKRAFRNAKASDPFIDQVVAFFSEFYHSFAATPSLSRDMLREITFSTGGIVAARIWASVKETEEHVAKLVARAQAEGILSSAVSPALAGHIIFSLYRAELRACMDTDQPDIDGSLARLREQLQLLLDGLSARPTT